MKIGTPLWSLAFVLVVNGASAQVRGTCGVMDPTPLLERVTIHQKTLAEASVQARSSVPKYVPVTFILVADVNGNGRIAEEKVLEQLAKLNYYYAPQEMIFYIEDTLRHLNHNLAYTDPSHNTSIFQMKIAKDPNSMNVYIPQNATTTGESPGVTLGFYSPMNDWIVIRKDEVSASNNTLAHEVGHFFGLPHPHSGWECEPYDEAIHGNPVSSLWSPCNGSLRVEFQNGTNCLLSGDRICDTSPDYNFGFGWSVSGDQCAEYTPQIMDPNGDLVEVTENNHMAYFIGCDDYMFTTDQKGLIQADFFSADRNYLRSDYVPIQDSVDNNVVYNYPINNEETPTFDNVDLDWEDVPGATDYLVIIARNSAFSITPQRVIVSESFLTIEALTPNVNYFWRVWPFNQSQTGAGWAPTQVFHTGLSSGVKTITTVDRFDVFPNPASSGQALNVVVQSSTAFDGEFTLHDMMGKVIQRTTHHIDAGRIIQIPFTLESIVPGLYFLKVRSSEGGILTKKVSFQ